MQIQPRWLVFWERLAVHVAREQVGSGQSRSGGVFSSHGVPSYATHLGSQIPHYRPLPAYSKQDLDHHCPFKGLLFSGASLGCTPLLLVDQVFLPQTLGRFEGAYPLLTTRVMHPVFYLQDPRPQASETRVCAPMLSGVRTLSLSAPFYLIWCRAGFHGGA